MSNVNHGSWEVHTVQNLHIRLGTDPAYCVHPSPFTNLCLLLTLLKSLFSASTGSGNIPVSLSLLRFSQGDLSCSVILVWVALSPPGSTMLKGLGSLVIVGILVSSLLLNLSLAFTMLGFTVMLLFATSAFPRTSGLESSVSLLGFCLSSSKVEYTLLTPFVFASGAKSLSALPDFGAPVLSLSANLCLLAEY